MDLSNIKLEARLPDGNMIRFRPFAEGDAEMIKDVYLHHHYDFLDLKAGEVVFDIGTHIGSFAIKAARLVGDEGIVAPLEPELENCRILMENIELNGPGKSRSPSHSPLGLSGRCQALIGGWNSGSLYDLSIVAL